MAQAIMYHQKGEYQLARELYEKILISDSNNAEALQYSGVIAMQTGNLERAIHLIEKAIAIQPNISGYHSNLAMAYKDNEQFQPALDHYKKAIALNPKNPVLFFNLGALYQTFDFYDKACNSYDQSLQINPDQPLVLHNLGNLLLKQGDVNKAIHYGKKAMKLAPDDPEIQSNYLFSLNYNIDYSPEKIINEHLKWGQKYIHSHSKKTTFHNKSRIHVGYVSPDFRKHSVSHFIKAILNNHNKKFFDIYCYSNVKKPDHITHSLKQCDVVWRDIFYQNDNEVYDQIQADGIHILVDLAGHSSCNRLMLFAKKPAPIQITYLGYPNTTGLSQIDYRLIDHHSDPDLNQFSGSERRICLPNGFLCYAPSEPTPAISEQSLSKSITFGSFNNLPKINKHVISLWSKIMKAVPDSRLLLKTNGFKVQRVREQFLAYFQDQGIDPKRIQLMKTLKSGKEHLSLYNEIDIALDTFPYNGTTTTCEALWMGVPVITLSGKHHAARVGESILNQTGLKAWVTHNETDYIKKAIDLANNQDDRLHCRKHLRKWLEQSLLCKKDLFVENLEQVYCQFIKQLLSL